ncbi:MAG: Na+/H+ antiporter subunit E [Spirochaetales bacterium]|nr:Na+/H+ antiporter subunit E [Spirochaetales bacterium]
MKPRSGLPYLIVSLAIVWVLVTASTSSDELLIGGLAVAIVALAVRNLWGVFAGIRFTPRAIVSAIAYFFIFLRELVKANLDVASRVLRPSLPIRPGIVEVRTGMRSSLGKLMLANSITLTPGTLTLDVRDDRMFIHWIDVQGQDADAATKAIVSGFENTLKEVME